MWRRWPQVCASENDGNGEAKNIPFFASARQIAVDTGRDICIMLQVSSLFGCAIAALIDRNKSLLLPHR